MLCCTGILLRRFLGDPTLEGVSHVIIDEVHERSVDVDLSLLLLRDLLSQGSHIKVILMSATANAQLFAAYFSNASQKVHQCLLLLLCLAWNTALSSLCFQLQLL